MLANQWHLPSLMVISIWRVGALYVVVYFDLIKPGI